MIARNAWFVRLVVDAPSIDWSFLWIVAAALDAADSVEKLLFIAEHLADGAASARDGGQALFAGELQALADLVGREAAWRSPTLGLPRQA